MKKFFIFAILIASAVSMHAQLKVSKIGTVLIGNDSVGLPMSPLSIGCAGNTKFQMNLETNRIHPCGIDINNYYQQSNNIGLRVLSETTGKNSSISLYSCNSGTTLGSSIGVKSFVSDNPKFGLALCGILSNTVNKGAAVYGGINPTPSSPFPSSGQYAGYFNGDVLSTGKIYGTFLTTYPVGSTSTASNEKSKFMNTIEQSSTITDKLTNLQLVSYTEPNNDLKQTAENSSTKSGNSESELSKSGNPDESDIFNSDIKNEPVVSNFKSKSDLRYAIEINTLKENYPEFVYSDSDGNQCIDYIGMIPLLIQSISNLKAEINKLKSAQTGAMLKSSLSSTSGMPEINTDDTTIVELAQNKPNPFDVSTKISLTLPESVDEAFLVVYDMNGKMVKQLRIEERGNTDVTLQAADFYRGMFLYTLIADGKAIDTKKMIIM